MDYKSTVTTIGPLVEEMVAEGNFIIVFNENAPESLAEMSILHTICEMDQEIKPGDVVIFGNNQYIVTAVGEEANHTLKAMGHCSFKFTGRENVELPGQIELSGGDIPEIKPGDQFEILFT